MKLNDIKSVKLLPEFSHDIDWVLNAFDKIVLFLSERLKSIDSPLTMESIEALTDEELQEYYNQYGLAEYYPDISRERRNWMLYQMARIWRYLGTPYSIETLVKYVWSDIEIDVKVHDNKAFTENNPGLVDTFDVEILPTTPNLPEEAIGRINDNIIKFSRNSQAFNGAYVTYTTEVTQHIAPALPYNGVVSVQHIQNYTICDNDPPVPPPVIVSFDFGGNFTTGDKTTSLELDGAQGYLDRYLVVTPLCESRGWNAGGNLNMAYFTSNGASETQNTELDYYESYRLYDENGNAIIYRAVNERYRITSAFRINKGSSAALWDQSDLNTWLKLQQVGQMFAYTEDEADMPSDTEIYAMMYSISPSITVLLGLRYDGNDWLSKTFDTDDFWWSGILSQNDKALIESIGLRTSVMFYGYGGQIGSIEYNAGYDYRILGLYSDISGTQQVQTDLSNLFVAPHIPTGDTKQYAAICNHTAITTPSMTWKVRINPKGTVVVAYKSDGTTSNGVQNGNKFIITAVDSNWHTEAQLNALGWYVQWNLYTFSAYSALNIRDTTSLSTSYVIAKWPQTETLVGNPYLEQTADGRIWQTVKFTLDGGATVQTGYCIVDSQVPVYKTTGTAQTDILTAENP